MNVTATPPYATFHDRGFRAFNGMRFSTRTDAHYHSFCWAASIDHLQALAGKPPLQACALWWLLLRNQPFVA